MRPIRKSNRRTLKNSHRTVDNSIQGIELSSSLVRTGRHDASVRSLGWSPHPSLPLVEADHGRAARIGYFGDFDRLVLGLHCDFYGSPAQRRLGAKNVNAELRSGSAGSRGSGDCDSDHRAHCAGGCNCATISRAREAGDAARATQGRAREAGHPARAAECRAGEAGDPARAAQP
jgi:hypothetical protein